jgi:hypothetical protein
MMDDLSSSRLRVAPASCSLGRLAGTRSIVCRPFVDQAR